MLLCTVPVTCHILHSSVGSVGVNSVSSVSFM